jgi:hypothetical protein
VVIDALVITANQTNIAPIHTQYAEFAQCLWRY